MAANEKTQWASLPLESYVLAQWASLATDDLGKRRHQLARQYAAIGYSGRYVGACNRCDPMKAFS